MAGTLLRTAATLALLLLPALAAACGGGGGGGGGAGGGAPAAVVESVTPAPGAVGVDPAAPVTIRFRTPMDEATLLGGSLVLAPAGSTAPVPAEITVALTKTEVLLVPDGPLSAGVAYQVRLAGSARRADGREIRRPWYSEFRVGGGGEPPPPPPPTQSGSARWVGALETGRSGHAAAALPDGRVAVFGGWSTSSTVTGSIELFDPATEEWTTSAATLGTPRAFLTATVLGDGRVLLSGGQTASTTDVGLDLWELFDPVLDAVTASGTMLERRSRHRAVRLPSGKVLVAGGSRTDSTGAPNYSRATSEIFDPSTMVYGSGPWMTVPRAGHEATLLPDGRVLVTGGHGTSALAEIFDPAAGSFVPGGTMIAPRRDHAAAALADGSVLACGGGGSFTAERWIASENRWVQVQNMGDVRSLHTAVRLANGRVFVAGGEKPGVGGGTVFHTATEYYNPGTGSFLFPDIPSWIPRSGHTCTPLPGGDWLVVGGKSNILNGPAVRSCDRFHFQ